MDNLLRHNIRNQMNAILGFTEIIEEKTLEEAAGEVAVIRRASERLLETAEKQRDIISALQSPIRREPIDLAAAVEAAVGAVREDHPETEVEVSLPDRLVVRAVDELRCAIAELLANAIHHSDDPTPGLTVEGRTADGEATLAVRDDCDPLAEFDRNVLTGDHDMDTVYHSSGCGLWLVYWTVDLSEGDIDYRYADGNVISLTLPLIE